MITRYRLVDGLGFPIGYIGVGQPSREPVGKERRDHLLNVGRGLLMQVIGDLNDLDARPPDEYRRESDLDEICIALALYWERVSK